jgi:ribosomal protein S18 acetylase RimI-like enzyme
MTSLTLPARVEAHSNLRPLNILRDLPHVADLIELCFSNSMDGEGRNYIRDMRRAGQDVNFLHWATRVGESASLPLSGYIWEENGRIIGNTSLVPFRHNKQRIYMIANVAVHPDYRRRGIARALTEHAMIHAWQKRADALWLHARADNPGAIKLYSDLGFVERACRTTWTAPGDPSASNLQTDLTIMPRHPQHWLLQQDWLSRFYPDELAWHRPWNFSALRPGFWNWLYLLFVDINIRQWAAVKGEQLEAILAWIPSIRDESLFAAIGPESNPQALTVLLLQARRVLSNRPYISLEYPAGEFDEAIQAAGFKLQRTLIWMRACAAT